MKTTPSHTIEIEGARRISLDEYFAGVRPHAGERYWVDQCLHDIANTVDAAIRQAHRAGACAVVLHYSAALMSKHRCLIDRCKELGLIVVLCFADYHREVYWRPT